jgi:hypothetical protein
MNVVFKLVALCTCIICPHQLGTKFVSVSPLTTLQTHCLTFGDKSSSVDSFCVRFLKYLCPLVLWTITLDRMIWHDGSQSTDDIPLMQC